MNTLTPFTKLYPVQKTLRFSLNFPVGNSLLNFKKDFDEKKQTFKADQKIEDAYQELKPKLDGVHELFIEKSLTSDDAKQINFEPYWILYEEKANLQKGDKVVKKNKADDLEEEEKRLRNKIVACYISGSKALKSEHGDAIKWKKASNNDVKGSEILNCEAVLQFVQKKYPNCEKTENAIKTFKGFYTALEGYNTNRKNYYSNEKKATSIANRIVHENLAKFCSNKWNFTKNETRFLKAFHKLEEARISLINKEEEPLKEIKSELFAIGEFSNCLSQSEIDSYNKKIGNVNQISNLYNQLYAQEYAQDKEFKKLPKLKILWKQIGCGKEDPLFYKLTHDTIAEAKKNEENHLKPYSVESVLKDVEKAGRKYFTKDAKNLDSIDTVGDFIHWLKGKNDQNNWEGIYWSKKAITNISNRFLANWQDILEKVKSIKSVASYNKKREEPIQFLDAVELKSLFEQLDQYQLNEDGTIKEAWTASFFKSSILKTLEEGGKINEKERPSKILINCLIEDLENHVDAFHLGTRDEKGIHDNNGINFLVENISQLKAEKAKKKDAYKMQIKYCMDNALAICHTIKYFEVSESKVKGTPIDSDLDHGLYTLLNQNLIEDKDKSNWFNWYDALRNYLTKRPQDDATKLKLYFESSTIGKGWSKSKESQYLCTILIKDKKYYLGIIDKKHNKIFNNLDINSIKKNIEENEKKKIEKDIELSKKKESSKIYDKLDKKIKEIEKDISSEEDKLHCLQDDTSTYQKMVYQFLKDGTKMIPKCSTQLEAVKKRFKEYEDLKYVELIPYSEIKNCDMADLHYIKTGKNDEGKDKFVTRFKITRKIFELNNLVYDKVTEEWVKRKPKDEKRPKKFQKSYYDITGDVEGYRGALKDWINFCRDFLNNYTKSVQAKYDYGDLFEKEYENLDEFYSKLKSKIYKIKFQEISERYINKCIEDGHLYLFQIYSKDFSEKSSGNKNLQTYFWQEVIKENSLSQLNGGAEIFYRKASIKYNKDVYKNGHHYEQQRAHCESEGKPFFPIIKDNRFAQERFSFHCPITLNYTAAGNPKPESALFSFNEKINEKENGNAYFLGIDRGEKHLIYFSLINNKGELIDQGSLNVDFLDKNGAPRSIEKIKYIQNKGNKVWEGQEVQCWNYNDLLDCETSHRVWARKNWQTIGKIKNLKEGYISQVIHEITKKIIENSDKLMFIVLEDLNTGFKRSRQKIEKQIYQKFETALAKKLNFIVDKSKTGDSLFSPSNAVQLTPPVLNYQDIESKKQVGVMFYTRANYTSITDPKTGWRKTIYLKSGSQDEIKGQILRAFDDFGFDGKDYFFEYTDNNTHKKWRLWSGKNGVSLLRYRSKRGNEKYEWNIEKIDVVKILDILFSDFDKGESLKKQIENNAHVLKKLTDKKHSRSPSKSAWESLRRCIDLIQQIRNSDGRSGDLDNFLHSPVRCNNGEHFNSINQVANKNASLLPDNADANGAYNIARKGLIMHSHIKVWQDNGKQKYDKNSSDLDLFVSDEEWDLWLADKSSWEEKLVIFSSRKKMELLRNDRKSMKKTIAKRNPRSKG